MRTGIIGLAFVLTSVVACGVRGDTLSPGDSAPGLDVSKWVKGEKVERFDPAKTYVVEFWATWCGPCRASIPHLTELQKKYKDDVTFIGVSVWESDQEKVEPFVKEMGEKMEYRVALDSVPEEGKRNEGKMATSWMMAADEHGIPTAFVVKDSKIAWIGHPMQLDTPLAKVVSGTWNFETAASERREEKAKAGKVTEAFRKFQQLKQQKKNKEALAVLEEALAADPKLEESGIGAVKFSTLIEIGDYEEAIAYGEKLVDVLGTKNPGVLNTVAWGLVDPASKHELSPRERKLALKAAERANEAVHGENAAILDTLARACFLNGDPGRARDLEERAITLSGRDDPAMKTRLEEYRKAAEDKGR